MQQTTRGWRERLAVVLGCLSRALWRGWSALRAGIWSPKSRRPSARMHARDAWLEPCERCKIVASGCKTLACQFDKSGQQREFAAARKGQRKNRDA